MSDRPKQPPRVHAIDPWGLGARRAQLDRFWDAALTAFAAEAERVSANDDDSNEGADR
ncbi:MAG TPA: hypothetical protein VMT68_15930 [Caulobacteraceae bacterium]|nr:hypothetical protein [Caulobacteraceae bacterium]